MPEVPIEHDADSGGEPEPDLAEVQQRDTYPSAVLVEQNGPVGVQQLPRRVTSCRNLTIVNGQDPQQIAGREPRRARMYLKVAAGSLYIGSRQDCTAGTGYVLESTSNLELTHLDPVWVTWAFGNPVLSVLIESWAD